MQTTGKMHALQKEMQLLYKTTTDKATADKTATITTEKKQNKLAKQVSEH